MKIVIQTVLIFLMIVGVIVLIRQSKKPSFPKAGITDKAASESLSKESLRRQGVMIPFSSETLDEAIANGKRPILFFHASWCPYCLKAESDIEEHSDVIPSNILILKIDYDTASQLKNQYGVITQDTFVLLDQNKKEVTKWQSGGEGVKTLLENVEKFL